MLLLASSVAEAVRQQLYTMQPASPAVCSPYPGASCVCTIPHLKPAPLRASLHLLKIPPGKQIWWHIQETALEGGRPLERLSRVAAILGLFGLGEYSA